MAGPLAGCEARGREIPFYITAACRWGRASEPLTQRFVRSLIGGISIRQNARESRRSLIGGISIHQNARDADCVKFRDFYDSKYLNIL